MKEKLDAFERLLTIMDELRAKCPWDKEQTFDSLRHLTIEEMYELSDAILVKDINEIKNELGDIMLHIVFYSKIASETNDFDVGDVINDLNKKLIKRHPHIYGNVEVQNSRDVRNNWEKIKMGEGRRSVLGGVPNALPALVKAYRIQEKASGAGFDWEEPRQVWEKVMEEKDELLKEVNEGSAKDKIEDEFGDLLFALVNYARFIKVNPEDALEKTNRRFIRRFNYMEEQVDKDGRFLKDMTLSEMDIYWNEAKKNEG
ncbi:MAG: nucleoside triphosphate pyrophosphohydrolase [Bacteroidetes bacterium]|nr:nucleoside triphosphate pyrophosphohydrolase [Bacteroidota bacterium]